MKSTFPNCMNLVSILLEALKCYFKQMLPERSWSKVEEAGKQQFQVNCKHVLTNDDASAASAQGMIST